MGLVHWVGEGWPGCTGRVSQVVGAHLVDMALEKATWCPQLGQERHHHSVDGRFRCWGVQEWPFLRGSRSQWS